jgi:sugar lactone lactonase YvrE
LNLPSGVFVDETGRVFIADTFNNRIRMVDMNGDISTVAGTDSRGYSGDGGPATSAQLNNPFGVFVDETGRVFIADLSNHRIRMVDMNGIITTIAGTDSSGYSGDGGPATSAKLNLPLGVFVDQTGRVFIADLFNHRIRMVDMNGDISTVAGTESSGYSGDGGPATSAKLNRPFGVFVDETGRVFIADRNNHRIRMVDMNGIISTVAGTDSGGDSGDGGPATSAELNFPLGVFVDQTGRVFIADTSNHRIRMVDMNGDISTVAGTGSRGYSGDGGPATSAELNNPYGVFVDQTRRVFVADRNNHRIRMFQV